MNIRINGGYDIFTVEGGLKYVVLNELKAKKISGKGKRPFRIGTLSIRLSIVPFVPMTSLLLLYVSELIGKETVETTSRSLSRGRSGSSSTSHQQTARDLMTPDEVRLLSNDKALLFVRGERPVMDWKYNLLRHPNIRFTEDGGAPPYDYTVAPDAHEDLAGNAENYELLDMDDFLPAAEQPKPMFTYPRRNAHASQQD